MLDRVAVLPDFVRADDGRDLVELAPAARDIWAKTESDALLVISL